MEIEFNAAGKVLDIRLTQPYSFQKAMDALRHEEIEMLLSIDESAFLSFREEGWLLLWPYYTEAFLPGIRTKLLRELGKIGLNS